MPVPMATSSSYVSKEKFRVLKRSLIRALNKLTRLENAAYKTNTSILEVTLIDRFLVLNIPGVRMKIEAHTSGSARFTIPLAYFTHIVKDQVDNTMEFHLSKDWLHVRSNSFPVKSTFFENDGILRSIELPVNYTQADLARLILSGKYTEEEIEFNGLKDDGEYALYDAMEDFRKVAWILAPYGLDKQFVKDMILEGLKR